MLLSCTWLSELLGRDVDRAPDADPTTLCAARIAAVLTSLGLEVEGIEHFIALKDDQAASQAGRGQLEARYGALAEAKADLEDRCNALERSLEKVRGQGEAREAAVRREAGEEANALRVELRALEAEREADKRRHREDKSALQRRKADEIEQVHVRVRATIARKDKAMHVLREQVKEAEARLEATNQLLERQREELISQQ